MSFYDQLKDLRKSKGFSIREVASRSGVSAAYISQLENGNRGLPSPEILQKLSDGLNTSYSSLMEMAGYLQTGADTPPSNHPINLRRLIRENEIAIDDRVLTAEEKDWLLRVLHALFWKAPRAEDGPQ